MLNPGVLLLPKQDLFLDIYLRTVITKMTRPDETKTLTGVGTTIPSGSPDSDEGLKRYYTSKIEELQLTVQEKSQDLRRQQAQRNEINAKVRMLREELQLLVRFGPLINFWLR